MPHALPYRIAVLVFLENAAGEHLLLHRAKPPNQGAWSPIGGKLEMATGESPFECAVRETREETGFVIGSRDLHLFAVIAEKSYEGQAHWLMFLFRSRRPLPGLPPDISEGRFGFFSRKSVDALQLPETDRAALWPTYDAHRERFVALRADCARPARPGRGGGDHAGARQPKPRLISSVSGWKLILSAQREQEIQRHRREPRQARDRQAGPFGGAGERRPFGGAEG